MVVVVAHESRVTEIADRFVSGPRRCGNTVRVGPGHVVVLFVSIAMCWVWSKMPLPFAWMPLLFGGSVPWQPIRHGRQHGCGPCCRV